MRVFKNILFITIILPLSIYCEAQESVPQIEKIIPPSPTAASLGVYGEYPVSLYTGTPNINIPLWDIQGRKVSLTIALNYHGSGIKVNDIAGWTGLGWTLQAGGIITRTVRGIADDHAMGYLTLHGNALPFLGDSFNQFGPWEPPGIDDLEKQQYLSEIADGRADSEPDVYFFNMNGRSGKMVMNGQGNPVVISQQNLDISYKKDPSGHIITWQIVDEYGTIYSFGNQSAVETSTPIDQDGSRRESFYSSWFLNEIRSANDEDTIQFRYNSYYISRRDPIPQRKVGNSDPKPDELLLYSSLEIDAKYLREIEYSKGIILFDTASFGIYLGGEIVGLNEITIKDHFSKKVIKSFRFNYSFFQTSSYGKWYDYLPPSRRLRLDNIIEFSATGNQMNHPYMFFYSSIPLPPRGSYAQDHWGYFNGAENDYFIPEVIVRNYFHYDSIPPTNTNSRGENIEKMTSINLNLPQLSENIWRTKGANREPNATLMQAGLLNRIVYPTGGSTIFEFEPHDYGFISIPRKPLQTNVYVSRNAYNITPTRNIQFLKIPFDQKIKIIPLFYILKGSIKYLGSDVENIPPSNHSRIFMVKEPDIEDPDTIFNLSYSDLVDLAGGMEAVYDLWVRKGNYEIGAISDEEGDYTEMIVYFDSVSIFDESYPIYSNDFESRTIMAGEKIWIDEESYYCSEVVEIDKEDETLVKIESYFRSIIHPNRVSSFGLDILHSKVRIIDLEDPDNILYENVYYDNDEISWNPDLNVWTQHQTISVSMNPGNYLVEFIPRIKTETGYISLTWREAVATHNRKITGGVRVKKIINIDNQSDTIGIKEFKYSMVHNGITRSSGVLQSWPVYYDLPDQIFYLNYGGIPYSLSYAPITLYSSGKNTLGSTQGSHIGYRQVTELIPNSGKTIYSFTSSWEFPDITSQSFPYPQATSFDWRRGLNKQTIKYSEEEKIRELETISFNELNDISHLSYIPALVVSRKFPESNSAFVYEKYANVSSWNHPVNKSIIRFDPNGENPVQFEEVYDYDPDHLQIKQLKRLDSDSSIYVERYYYPGDPDTEPSSVTADMITKHMVNTVLKMETSKDSELIFGTRINYEFFNGDQLFPASRELLVGADYKKELFFDRYDKNGNLLQFHRPGDHFNSINWGWNGNYPVAEISNSPYYENLNLYTNESRVTKYSYIPLIGINAVTTPDDISTFYEYDDFGRLILIKNQDQKILESIDYHYKSYKGDTTRTYWAPQYFDESSPADFIYADLTTIAKNCSATLSVSGGSLGTDGKWEWFEGSCGGEYIGSGPVIKVTPFQSTSYFVRASGIANVTECRDIRITVVPVSFNLMFSELDFEFHGNPGNPQVVETNYTGCDPWYVSVNQEWLTIVGKNENNFSIMCDRNDNLSARTGKIFLYGGGQEDTITVNQKGSVSIEINYSPSTLIFGDDVTLSATVLNGSSPYLYSWETRLSGSDTWTVVRSYSGSESTDTFLFPSVTTSFEVRCSVTTAGYTFTSLLEVTVAE